MAQLIYSMITSLDDCAEAAEGTSAPGPQRTRRRIAS